MKYHPHLQPRDYETFEPLVFCYRLTTAHDEAKRHGINVKSSRHRLNQLTDGGYLNRLTAWASPIPPINAPLAAWTPSDPEPDFAAIAYVAQTRWQNRPVRQQTVYTASRKLLAMFAKPPRPKVKLHHATHDLGVLHMYFYAKERWPQYEFIGEDIFGPQRGHGEGVEDAQLVDGDRIVAVLEYAGQYRKERVRHFHEHVKERNLCYFLF